MKFFNILLCCISITSLSACQTLDALESDVYDISHGNIPVANVVDGKSETLLASPCPQVEIVNDLSSISDFTNPKKQKKKNLISRVDIKSAESTCKLASKSAIIDLKLIFDGELGTKGRVKSSDKPFFSYPFFIAVTSPGGKIMAKEIFAASLTYGSSETTHIYSENLRQIIPITSKKHANQYRVLIGFQVTPEQLAYNREHMVPIEDAKVKIKTKKK